MKKLVAAGAIALVATFSASAFAQSGTFPGIGKGSMGSTVENSSITLKGNKASHVMAAGGSGSAAVKGINIEASALANVNSVNIKGSTVKNSKITLTDNTADDIKAFGGAVANVNSVNIE